MAKEVLCPICGASYNLADEQLGKKVRCKKCEHAFTAGGEPTRRRDDDDDDDDDRIRDRRGKSRAKKGRDREDEEEAKPKKTKTVEEQAKPRGQEEPGLPVSSFVIMGVVVGVLVLCCGGGGLMYWIWPSRPVQQNAPQNNPPQNNPPQNNPQPNKPPQNNPQPNKPPNRGRRGELNPPRPAPALAAAHQPAHRPVGAT
jgi:predicted Zn finger-like uncharacterized protein